MTYRWRRAAMALLGMVLGVALTVVLAATAQAAQQGEAAQPPETPIAPPVDLPGGLGPQQCAPPATGVVPELPWAQERLAPGRAWDLTRGAGITVAVIDSGVDASVPQLAGRVLPGMDILRQNGRGDTDCAGHGTFVAGIIAGRPMPGLGFAGVAPEARILPVRQFDVDIDGSVDGLAASIVAAVDAGAKVINISSSAFRDSPVLRGAVEYATARNALIVASVANEAGSGNPTSYPAAYPEVVAVGAIDREGGRADFSETGAFVDLVAPGEQILSLGRGGPGHLQGDGSSFAAPFVAGVAALVRAYHPDLTVRQVKQRLEATADRPGAAVPDPQFGYGVVNPYAAVAMVLPEEQGPTAVARPVPIEVPVAAAPSTPGRQAGLLLLAAAMAMVAAAGIGSVIIPRGRRRRWQAASSSTTAKERQI